MTEDARQKSKERAKTTALVLATTGLNALLPGAGTLGIRLGAHIFELVAANRLARLDEFHRRVFEGSADETEITARFAAMQDGDFQHLLTAMLVDIESEKVAAYSRVYIHLVEHQEIAVEEKRMWVLAITQLHKHDLWVLENIVNGRWHEDPGDSEQRLAATGLISLVVRREDSNPPSGSGYVPDSRNVSLRAESTKFAQEFLGVLQGVR